MIGPLLAPANGVDINEILRQLDHSYYSLTRQGVSEFRCRATPEWDPVFKSLQAEAKQGQLRDLLDGTYFEVAVGTGGRSAISHHIDGTPPNEEAAAQLRAVTSGVEQMLTGMFEMWSPFMFESLGSSEDGGYTLEEIDGLYSLAQRQGTTNVVLLLTRDLEVRSLTITEPEVEIITHPKFTRGKNGFLLVRFDCIIRAKPSSSVEQQNEVKVTAKFEYQNVQGLELPGVFTANVTYSGAPLEVPVHFSDCKLKRR